MINSPRLANLLVERGLARAALAGGSWLGHHVKTAAASDLPHARSGSNQTHMAITGPRAGMRLFPFVASWAYEAEAAGPNPNREVLAQEKGRFRYALQIRADSVNLRSALTEALRSFNPEARTDAPADIEAAQESLIAQGQEVVAGSVTAVAQIRGTGQRQLELGRSGDSHAWDLLLRAANPADKVVFFLSQDLSYDVVLVPASQWDEHLEAIPASEFDLAATRLEVQLGRAVGGSGSGNEPDRDPEPTPPSPSHAPTNTVLFGPPGTGKTRRTIELAVRLADPVFYQANGSDRAAIVRRFGALKEAGRIAFVTFHQNFSYEDFVEGIKATTVNGAIHYSVEPGIFKSMCRNATPVADGVQPAHVLVIDEINRGNVSKIFGDLISLIEPSKRLGAPEQLTLTLPYSRDSFGVPSNLHLIATMNSADRSLVGFDLALRRRFDFIEMVPAPSELDEIEVEGINISVLLRVLNSRIELLLDRDHRIGHAYFIPLRADPSLARLAAIFENQVIPLLQEYFFDDWQRVAWVLNDHQKPDGFRFVSQRSTNVASVFGPDVELPRAAQLWEVNQTAFTQADSFRLTIDSTA